MMDPQYYSKQYSYMKESMKRAEEDIEAYTKSLISGNHPRINRQLTQEEYTEFKEKISQLRISIIDGQKFLEECIIKGESNGEMFPKM